jgi:transglutaminase-like putative cysteine protease
MSVSPPQRQESRIAHGPLIGVIAGLAMTTAPLFPRVAFLGAALFLAACAARLFINWRLARLPSTEVKVLLFGVGVGAVALHYGSVLGIEPGLTILVLLVSLKLLETNNVRDFQVITLLGYFLALCDLFFSQDLIVWLYVALAFLVLTAALIRFHCGWRGMGYGRAAWLGGRMFLQGLPLVVILFLFFPRVDFGFRFQFGRPLLNSNGMSDSLSPGSISALALNDEVAFRAEFPDGHVPPMSTMYWRALVFWQGDDLVWSVGPHLQREYWAGKLGGPSIRQRISLQPHGDKWLFALDRPASDVRGATYVAGDCLINDRTITSTLLYDVTSRPENRETTLPPLQLAAALRKPWRVSPAVKKLVGAWRAASPDDRAVVQMAMKYFRDERFAYTLEPGLYPKEGALDEFLFTRRKGFCEHYAAAFATLMRIAGIPSRVVVGYHGGEFNQIGQYMIVRQSDAHAWCEVWLRDRGWLRVDPTDMIAPDRLGSGFDSYLEGHPADPAAAARVSTTFLGWREIMRDVLLAWDSINYEWDLRVLNFDQDNQRTFLSVIGLRDVKWPQILGGVAFSILLLLALLALLLRRPGRLGGDHVGRWYARFCRTAAAGGVRREPWEGPKDFGERVAARFPAQAPEIREITWLYIQSRYAAQPPLPADFVKAVRALPKLVPSSPREPSQTGAV